MLEFLGLPGNKGYKEKDLEQAILDNLSDFLMEMGKGFAFVARQQLIRTETEDYYIDLVFYNYLLKAFVLVDLKVGKISHQDVGQMDMYVRMYDELKRSEGFLLLLMVSYIYRRMLKVIFEYALHHHQHRS